MKLLKIFLIACVVVLSTFAFSACGSKKVKWSEWECIIAPTCSSQGVEARTSNKGKTEMRAIDIDSTAHTACYCWITVVAASCEEEGQEKMICMDCGGAETRQINAIGHLWSDWLVTKNATCETAGFQKRLCVGCANIDTQSIPAIGHTWSNWSVVTAATCDENGKEKRICAECNSKETNQIPATGHAWSNWSVVTAATCNENGEEERVCVECSSKETNQIPVIYHVWSDWSVATAPTCTEDGEEERLCAGCDNRETNLLPAMGHEWEDWSIIKSATCTKSGKEYRTCSMCQEKEVSIIPSLGGHEWSEWQVSVPATCKKVGKESKTCAACTKTENRTIPALGHNFVLEQVAPTCESNGFDKYTCANCGFSYRRNKVEALGHDWTDWSIVEHPTRDTDGNEQRTCNNCSESETIVLPSIIKRLSAAAEEFIEAVQQDVASLGNSSRFYFNPANYTELEITSKSTSLVSSGNGSSSIVNGLINLSNFNNQSQATVKLTVILMLEGVKCEVVINLDINYASESGGYNWALAQSSFEIQN